jgi:hypothetical protein
MKWFIVVALMVGLIAGFSLVSTSEGSVHGKDPLIGAWESIDLDGSYQRLMIGGGPGDVHQLLYFDHYATACGGDQAIAKGYGGGGDPHRLEAQLVARCLKSGEMLDGWTPVFTYDSGLDVLVQETHAEPITWERQGANVGHPHMP